MEICAVTGVQIPENSNVVLLSLVQVRELSSDSSILWTKGAHSYFEPVVLPLFGKTDSDRVFVAAGGDSHTETLLSLTSHESIDDLTDSIVQGGNVSDLFHTTPHVDSSFQHVFVVRSVWDELVKNSAQIAEHVNSDSNLARLKMYLREIAELKTKTGDDALDESNQKFCAKLENTFNTLVCSTYCGLNETGFKLYHDRLFEHSDLLRQNCIVYQWMNAFGRLVMPSFSGQAKFKEYHIKLCQRAYNSVKKELAVEQ